MLLTITAKHIEMTNAIKEYIETKTAKLPKYYDSINKMEVVVDGNDGGKVAVELIASAEHGKIFIARETGADMYTCIDLVTHKIERQISEQKKKERNNKHHGNGSVQISSETTE